MRNNASEFFLIGLKSWLGSFLRFTVGMFLLVVFIVIVIGSILACINLFVLDGADKAAALFPETASYLSLAVFIALLLAAFVRAMVLRGKRLHRAILEGRL